MKENNPFMKWMKKVLKKDKQPNDGEPKKKPSLYLYMLVALVLGVVFMMGSEYLTKKSDTASSSVTPTFKEQTEDVETFGSKSSKVGTTISDYERAFEDQIKEALETMVGVKDVTVIVNLDATEKKVYEKNKVIQDQTTEETDREGGKRKVTDTSTDEQLVLVRDGEKEVPIVRVTEKPVVRGVLVVAKGADNITVKKWIVEAVTRTLDIPSHRVAVMPKK